MNMVDIIFHIAIGITDKFGYIGILLVMLLDYSCIPIPTEVIIPLIGCGVAEGEYGFLYVILFASIGGTIGALISYTIGSYGGSAVIKWIEGKFKASKKGFDVLHKLFDKYGRAAVFLGRILPLTRIYVSFFAGAERINKIQYTIFSAMGIFLWTTVMVTVGFYVGDNIKLISYFITKYSIIITIIVAIGITIFIILKKRKNKAN